MSREEKWGPDVREAMEAGIRYCPHTEKGTLHRTVSAGGGLIGCHMESYYGCLHCKKDLSGERLAEEIRAFLETHQVKEGSGL